MNTWLVLTMSLLATAVLAETRVITTRDRGDGTPGLGADGWVSESGPGALKSKQCTGRNEAFIMIRCREDKQDTGYLRFDLSGLNGQKVQQATLKLYFKGTDKDSITVMGIKDGIPGVNRAGGDDVNDHDADQHDEFWKEKLLDRESAPGLKASDGLPLTVDQDPDAVVFFGRFSNPGAPGEVTFSSEALTRFINDDRNGVVTILLQGSIHSSRYAAKECPDGLAAPALELTWGETGELIF